MSYKKKKKKLLNDFDQVLLDLTAKLSSLDPFLTKQGSSSTTMCWTK